MDFKEATSPGLVASSPNAARPETPAAVEAGRTFHRSPKSSAVSRSLDLTSISMDRPPRSERLATAPSFSLRELEQLAPRSSSTAGATLMPQPPAVGSPAASSTSSRIRSFSSRNLPVRTSSSVSQLQENGIGGAAELQSPPLAASVAGDPLTPDTVQPTAEAALASADAPKAVFSHRRTGSTPPPLHKLPQPTSGSAGLPAATSPFGAPRIRSSTSIGAAAAARPPITPSNLTESGQSTAAASPSSFSGGDMDTDPWVALRAQCMAAYGESLSSDDDESDENLEEYGSGPRRLVLLRHPSLVTHSLSRSFRETTTTTTTTTANLTVMPASVSTSQNGQPGPLDRKAFAASASASISAASAVKDSAPTGSTPAESTSAGSTFRVTTRAEDATSNAGSSSNAAASTAVATPPVLSPPRDAAPAPAPDARNRSGAVAKDGFPVVSAATVIGTAPDLSAPALSRARLAAAATMQLSQAQTGSAAHHIGRSTPPAARRRETSPSLSPTASSDAASTALAPAAVVTAACLPHRSESGTSSTTRSTVANLDPKAPRGRHGSSDGDNRSPFISAAGYAAAVLSLTPQQQHITPHNSAKAPLQRQHAMRGPGWGSPPASAGTPVAKGLPGSSNMVSAYTVTSLESQLRQHLVLLSPIDYSANAGGIAAGTVDKRPSESGGPGVAVGSILDVAPLNADPFRKRRLSTDGLSRHANKYGAGIGGGSGGSSGAAAQPPTTPGAEDVSFAGRDKLQGGDKGGSPNSAVSGRAPLITALAFERAPWSHSSNAAATAPASQGASTSPSVAAVIPSAAQHSGAILSAGAKLTLGFLPRVPDLPLGLPNQRPQLGIGQGFGVGVGVSVGGASSVTERMGDTAAAAVSAATAVDKLRGYKSSKVLLGTTLSLSNNPSGPATSDTGPSPSSIAVTGLSPPMQRPKLGPFASMRTLGPPATGSSFLERLSGGSSSSRTGIGRANSRWTIASGSGGGGAVVGDSTAEANRHNTFRSRDGSYSLDGSGFYMPTEEQRFYPPRPGLNESPGAGATAPSSSAASWSRPPASVHSARSLKHILPRGANGLPLAWSAIAEDGREGTDGGREEDAGGVRDGDGLDGSGEGKGSSLARGERRNRSAYDEEAKEVENVERRGDGDEEEEKEEEEEEEEEEDFNGARVGSWIDLHQTC